jgi:hypothetical protein
MHLKSDPKLRHHEDIFRNMRRYVLAEDVELDDAATSVE